MIPSIKIFRFYLCIFLCVCGQSCSYFSTPKQEIPADIVETNPTAPFGIREPNDFQSEILVTFYNDNGAVETQEKYFYAAKNDQRYVLFPSKKGILVLDAFTKYRFDAIDKTYSEFASPGEGDEIEKLISVTWLNEVSDSEFEKLNDQNGMQRFHVKNGKADDNIIVTFDPQKHIVVKLEFLSKVGEIQTLTYSFEVNNFKEPAEANLFAVPSGYAKID